MCSRRRPADAFEELLQVQDLALRHNRNRSWPDGLFDQFSRFDGMQANWDPPDHAGAYLHIKRLLDLHDVTSPGEFITAPPVVDSERLVTVYESESAGRGSFVRQVPEDRFPSAWMDGSYSLRNTDPSAPAKFREFR